MQALLQISLQLPVPWFNGCRHFSLRQGHRTHIWHRRHNKQGIAGNSLRSSSPSPKRRPCQVEGGKLMWSCWPSANRTIQIIYMYDHICIRILYVYIYYIIILYNYILLLIWVNRSFSFSEDSWHLVDDHFGRVQALLVASIDPVNPPLKPHYIGTLHVFDCRWL